jgi:hypothetical protein
MLMTKSYNVWSNAETDALLEWLSVPDNYRSYCTGTKTRAYTAIAEALRTKTRKQVENKVKKMLRDYKRAIDWRNATGRGVEEAGGTIQDELSQRCSRFAELDAIFGTRPNLDPPSIREVSVPGNVPEDADAMLEDGLSDTGEASDRESTTAGGSQREASSSASSVQPRREKSVAFAAALLEMSEKKLEVEREERERRLALDERKMTLEEKAHELAVRKLEMEKQLAEERTLMLRLELEKLTRR